MVGLRLILTAGRRPWEQATESDWSEEETRRWYRERSAHEEDEAHDLCVRLYGRLDLTLKFEASHVTAAIWFSPGSVSLPSCVP